MEDFWFDDMKGRVEWYIITVLHGKKFTLTICGSLTFDNNHFPWTLNTAIVKAFTLFFKKVVGYLLAFEGTECIRF